MKKFSNLFSLLANISTVLTFILTLLLFIFQKQLSFNINTMVIILLALLGILLSLNMFISNDSIDKSIFKSIVYIIVIPTLIVILLILITESIPNDESAKDAVRFISIMLILMAYYVILGFNVTIHEDNEVYKANQLNFVVILGFKDYDSKFSMFICKSDYLIIRDIIKEVHIDVGNNSEFDPFTLMTDKLKKAKVNYRIVNSEII